MQGVKMLLRGAGAVYMPDKQLLDAAAGVTCSLSDNRKHKAAVEQMMRLVDWDTVYKKPPSNTRKRKRDADAIPRLDLSSLEKARLLKVMQDITRDLHLIHSNIIRCQQDDAVLEGIAKQLVAVKQATDTLIKQVHNNARSNATTDNKTPLLKPLEDYRMKIRDILAVLQALAGPKRRNACQSRWTWSSGAWYSAELMLLMIYWAVRVFLLIIRMWETEPLGMANLMNMLFGFIGLDAAKVGWKRTLMYLLGAKIVTNKRTLVGNATTLAAKTAKQIGAWVGWADQHAAVGNVLKEQAQTLIEKANWVEYFSLNSTLQGLFYRFYGFAARKFGLNYIINFVKKLPTDSFTRASAMGAAFLLPMIPSHVTDALKPYLPMLKPSGILSMLSFVFDCLTARKTPSQLSLPDINARRALNTVMERYKNTTSKINNPNKNNNPNKSTSRINNNNNNKNNWTNARNNLNSIQTSSGTSYYNASSLVNLTNTATSTRHTNPRSLVNLTNTATSTRHTNLRDLHKFLVNIRANQTNAPKSKRQRRR